MSWQFSYSYRYIQNNTLRIVRKKYSTTFFVLQEEGKEEKWNKSVTPVPTHLSIYLSTYTNYFVFEKRKTTEKGGWTVRNGRMRLRTTGSVSTSLFIFLRLTRNGKIHTSRQSYTYF